MKHSEDDTITAVSTPVGEGGMAVIRISGSESISIADRIFKGPKPLALSESHRVFHGWIVEDTEPIDEVVVAIFKNPKSYTGEDLVEISCHGGIFLSRRILELTVKKGARPAQPGEFTKRAFLNGKLDLSQAEAVADLIQAKTENSRKVAIYQLQGNLSKRIFKLKEKMVQLCSKLELELDFCEEDIEFISREELRAQLYSIKSEIDEFIHSFDRGRLCREGLRAVIVGKPNVGKSSVLNALLEKERAIVAESPGTTRDTVEDVLDLDGLLLTLTDTAGIRITSDPIENEGVRRAEKAIEIADMILLIVDGSQDLTSEDDRVIQSLNGMGKMVLCVINKIDLPQKIDYSSLSIKLKLISPKQKPVEISASKQINIEKLIQTILKSVLSDGIPRQEEILLTNTRHRDAFLGAKSKLAQAEESIKRGMSQEFIVVDIRGAMDDLEEISGKTTPDMILDKIFSEFCIGK
jgi:tRNA modification GTPase